ncbi:MAG: DMT family transporter [Eubacteriales bacterium]|nr:DMT family transporter [Eubacteriales bacterium]
MERAIRAISARNWARLALLFVTVVWGAGFVAADVALRTYRPSEILLFRFISGLGLSLLPLIWQRRPLAPLVARSTRGYRRGRYYALACGFCLFLGFLFQTEGLQFTTPSKNAFLTSLNVIVVPFLEAIFGRERLRPSRLVAAGLALFGVGLLTLDANFQIGLGDGLSFICAFCFAAQMFLLSLALREISSEEAIRLELLSATVFGALYYLVVGLRPLRFEGLPFLGLLFLGFISTGLCYFLQSLSQRYLSASETAIILSLIAVFACLFSVWLLGEALSLRMLLGALCIMMAVIGINFFEDKRHRL